MSAERTIEAASESQEPMTPEQGRMLVGLLVGILVAGLDSTIVATILPRVLVDLGSIHLAPWVFASYMLTQVATAPIFGKLSDQFGRKRLFLVGLAIFLLGSEIAAFAPDIRVLVAARAIQGVGAGALFPVALSTVFLIYPQHLRGRLQGLFSGIYGLANLLGPALGVLLVSRFGWRSAFHVNVPVVAFSAFMIIKHFRDVPAKESRVRIDGLGAAVLMAAVVAFSLGVMGIGNGASSLAIVAGLALAVVLFGLFVVVEARHESPILPLYFVRTKLRVITASLLTGAMMYSAIFFAPMFVRAALGGGGAAAGLALVPLTLSVVIGSISAGRRIDRRGIRSTALIGAALAVTGFALASTMTGSVSMPRVIVTMAIIGLGVGGLLVSMVNAMQVGTPARYMGVSSSLSQLFRNLGGLLGVNLLGAVQLALFLRSSDTWSQAARDAVTSTAHKDIGALLFAKDGALSEAELAPVRDAYGHATTTLFLVGVALALGAGAIAATLRDETNAEPTEDPSCPTSD